MLYFSLIKASDFSEIDTPVPSEDEHESSATQPAQVYDTPVPSPVISLYGDEPEVPSPNATSEHTPDNNTSSESSDNEDFPLDNYSDDDVEDGNDYFGIPLHRPPTRPMINFPGDVDHEDDFELGWEWLERDTGPMIAPYSGFRQCLLDPTRNKPEDFFNSLFDSAMYTKMAEETNRYANEKLQNEPG